MEPPYIGMGGWELFPFNRYFYPPGANRDFRKLAYYAQFFDAVEVNATFYNTALTSAHAQRWLADVADNPRFVFTVKLYRGFTHTFDATRADAAAVMAMLDPLAAAGKLGGVVMQFPSSFTNLRERRLYLARLARLFRPHRLFVEVRHRSWNDRPTPEFFRASGLHAVNVDLPRLGQHMPFTAHAWDGAAYFRMMGRNAAAWQRPWRLEEDGKHVVSDRYLYRYSPEELDGLLNAIAKVRAHAETIFVVFHNDPEANSLINGFQLRFRTRQKQPMLLPGKLLRVFPALGTLGAPAPPSMPLFAGAA